MSLLTKLNGRNKPVSQSHPEEKKEKKKRKRKSRSYKKKTEQEGIKNLKSINHYYLYPTLAYRSAGTLKLKMRNYRLLLFSLCLYLRYQYNANVLVTSRVLRAVRSKNVNNSLKSCVNC